MALNDILQGLEDQRKRIEANLQKIQDKPATINPEVIPIPEGKPGGKKEAQNGIDKLDPDIILKLSVPLLAVYLKRGVSQAEISRICNVSKQAVNDYIHRHADQLTPLIDRDDGIMAMTAKHIAAKAGAKLQTVLDDEMTKKDLVALNMVYGTAIDKARLLSGASTQNISIAGRFMMLQGEAEE